MHDTIMRAIPSILLAILLWPVSLFAGSIIQIDAIDARSAFPTVVISLSVNDGWESLREIDDGDLQVLEDGVPVNGPVGVIKVPDQRKYLYLVFSVDSSRSISKKLLAGIKASARDIVRSMGPRDRIAVYRFDNQVVLLNDFTKDSGELLKSIGSINRHGSKTFLYNAIYDSIAHFDRVRYGNKKIIVFTDGKDEGSSVTGEDIVAFARSAGIPIYFICVRNDESIKSMASIARRTGGKLIFSTDRDNVPGMYRTILSGMRNRYQVQYTTSRDRKGKGHTVEVRLKRNGLRDRDARTIQPAPPSVADALHAIKDAALPLACIVICVLMIAVIVAFIIRERRFMSSQLALSREMIEMIRSGNEPGNGPVHELLTAGETESAELKIAPSWLMQKSGADAGKKYTLRPSETTIGRGKDNVVVINDTHLADHHAKIKAVDGAFHLFDLLSETGTFLNGKKMLRPKMLHDWDEIVMGKTVLIFRGVSGPR